MITIEQINMLLPLACVWAAEQEEKILREGVPLSAREMGDAKHIGVAQPEKVRLLKVTVIPTPEHPILQAAGEATGLICSNTSGLSLRHGVFIRADCWGNRKLVFHELVHTSQFERMGGIRQFLEQYLMECITIGYPAAPMEQEAIITTAEKCV